MTTLPKEDRPNPPHSPPESWRGDKPAFVELRQPASQPLDERSLDERSSSRRTRSGLDSIYLPKPLASFSTLDNSNNPHCLPHPPSRSQRRLELLVLAAIAFLGLLHLSYPLDGDQAFFALGALEMQRGEVLYQDFWDVKQPGIFWFYGLAIRLFGSSPVGVHLLELLLLIGFGRFLQVALRSRFGSLAPWAPLLTVGFYYCTTAVWHLTQVESLIGMPMFLCVWWAARGAEAEAGERGRSQRWRFFLSGVMGGTIILFKSVFLLILLPIWLLCGVVAAWNRRRPIAQFFTVAGWALLGFAIPLGLMLAYFCACLPNLELLYDTFWVYPSKIVAEMPAQPTSQLFDGLRWFARKFLPLLVLGGLGGVSLVRRRNLLGINLVLWVLIGLGVILLQKQGWWQYYYMLFFVPLGLLSLEGLRLLGQTWRPSPRQLVPMMLVLVLLFSTPLRMARHKVAVGLQNTLAIAHLAEAAPPPKMFRPYADIEQEVAFLRAPDALPGEIYVAGDPKFYYLSGRGQATTLHGWAIKFLLPEQWARVRRELAERQPPYIFIDEIEHDIMQERSPETLALIESRYDLMRQADFGTWYQIQPGPPAQS